MKTTNDLHADARIGLSRYTARFAGGLLDSHGVCSALGAWLLVALAATDADQREHDLFAGELGCEPAAARAFALELLADPHPAVAAAVAVWANENLLNDRYRTWAGSLPSAVESGPIPAQRDADRWANERTLGMIGKFPVPLRPDTAVVLASALATKIAWTDKFDEVDASELDGGFATTASQALRPPAAGHATAIFATSVGLVAAHAARSSDGLSVVSVIGDEGLDARALQTAAVEVADTVASPRPGAASYVPLFELELGDGPAWTITEQVEVGSGRPQRFDVVLPAWSAKSDFDLAAAPGVGETAAVMRRWLVEPGAFEAKQSAVAKYGAEGFEAAAVTAMAFRAAGMPRREERLVRTAHVRFNRRYAVVATAVRPGGRDTASDVWVGVPVFSALVEHPD